MKYRTIYADPAWPERGGGKVKRGADRHYPVMTVDDIKALDVQSLADDSCHLYLWTTNNHLEAAFGVIKAWGFRYITCITWAKPKVGLGQYFRGQTEHVLFATCGFAMPYKSNNLIRMQGSTLLMPGQLFEQSRTHSRKPEEMRYAIERVSYPPRIELFARYKSKGWDHWGNEVETDITLNQKPKGTA